MDQAERVVRDPTTGRILGTTKRTEVVTEAQFWKRVDKRGPDDCWPWTGGRTSWEPGRDYGSVWRNGTHWKAHRLAWVYKNGTIPDGLKVLHKCDNPPCCNPSHLFTGTDLDNARDCFAKGRAKRERGEDRYNAVLTEQKVQEIRRRYKPRHPTDSGAALGREFGVGKTMISAIVGLKKWRHV